jgi:hypothetical protein
MPGISIPAPVIGGSSANAETRLAGMIGGQLNQSQGPIRAYILNQDIKSANQFDRRIAAATKL